MAITLEVKSPNITLLRLVVNNRELFHNQDWYFDEEFANIPLKLGWYALGDDHGIDVGMPSATLCAHAYLTTSLPAMWNLFKEYRWTTDMDNGGNLVYVGGTKHKGGLFQIHRHLKDPDVRQLHGGRV